MAAQKKSEQGDVVVALDPMVVYTDRAGAQQGVYQGAQIARDAVDPDHLKHLEEIGAVGSVKEAEKAAEADSES